MGQIIGGAAKPKRCNLNRLSQLGTPAAGEHILVSTDNSMNAAGQGNFDAYIVGNGTTAATALELKKIDGGVYDEVFGIEESSETYEEQTLISDHYFNLNNNTIGVNPASYTGAYCAKISVVTGDKFRIYGLGGASAAGALWGTSNASRARLRRSANSLNGRVTPVEVIIEEGEAYLYVNLNSYDATTDKVLKVITTEIHVEGLVERVEDLESVEVNVVDNLTSTSSTNALSANQGRILNEDINGVTTEHSEEMEILVGKGFNGNNGTVPSKVNLVSDESAAASYLYVAEGEKYRIFAASGGTSATRAYFIADSSRTIFEASPNSFNSRQDGFDLTMPSGAAILLVVYRNYNASTDHTQKITQVTTECVKTRIEALETEDANIQKLAFPLMGKKVLFFGDSQTQFKGIEGKGLIEYFAEMSLATCIRGAVGGARYTRRTSLTLTPSTESEARAALDVVEMVRAWTTNNYDYQDAAVAYLNDYGTIIANLKANPVSDVDIVMFASGGNDLSNSIAFGEPNSSSVSEINGAINQMITMLLTAKPSLKIYSYSMTVTYRNNVRDDENWSDNRVIPAYNKTIPQCIELLKERVEAWHFPYIDLYNTLGWNQLNFSQYFYDTDGTHPFKGFDVMGRRLYEQVVKDIQ